MIEVPTGTRIWIAAGITDMRRGFQGLSAQVQTVLERQPFSGHVFVFRGRHGDMVKLLWFDGDDLCLFQKQRQRGVHERSMKTIQSGSLGEGAAAMPFPYPDSLSSKRLCSRMLSLQWTVRTNECEHTFSHISSKSQYEG